MIKLVIDVTCIVAWFIPTYRSLKSMTSHFLQKLMNKKIIFCDSITNDKKGEQNKFEKVPYHRRGNIV